MSNGKLTVHKGSNPVLAKASFELFRFIIIINYSALAKIGYTYLLITIPVLEYILVPVSYAS